MNSIDNGPPALPESVQPASPLAVPESGGTGGQAESDCAEYWLHDLKATGRYKMSWLWQGYLSPGNITLLTSQWKAGKTTLVSVLLDRLKSGGQVAGLPLAAGKAVVVSEESPVHWYRRCEKFAFGDHVCWICRPFHGKPSVDEWLGLLDRLIELHHAHGISLAVINTLAAFLPGHRENAAGSLLEMLMPLHRLTAAGMSVLVLHHPRKRKSADGLAARAAGHCRATSISPSRCTGTAGPRMTTAAAGYKLIHASRRRRGSW